MGFSSQAKRFLSQVCLVGDLTVPTILQINNWTKVIQQHKCDYVYLFQNENPGPGSYGCISSAEVQSPSFSKKGTTGFVPSKVRWSPSHLHWFQFRLKYLNKHWTAMKQRIVWLSPDFSSSTINRLTYLSRWLDRHVPIWHKYPWCRSDECSWRWRLCYARSCSTSRSKFNECSMSTYSWWICFHDIWCTP